MTTGWRQIMTPLSLALVSLLAAIGLWVAVTDAENPDRVAVFPGAIEVVPVNLPEGLAVARLSSPTVSLRIRADEDTFSELTVDNFRAVVDMSGERQNESDKVVIASTSRRDVDIVEVSPPIVSVTLEPSATKVVPVQPRLVGSPAQGFRVPEGGIETDPGSVRVSGAASLVQLVAVAAADINLTGLRVDLQQRYTLVPRDARGADMRGLNLEPSSAEVRVSIVQQEVTLGLTIVPQLQGTPAEGYNVVNAAVDPPAIAVSGPLELLQSLSFLITEPIDLSGLRADATRNVRLRLPPGLQSTRDTVTVRLRVVPAPGEILLSVAPQVSGVAEGLRATVQTAAISLRLGGELPLLRSIQPGSVKATVNASGLAEGVHVLQPQVSVPDGVRLIGADPPQVVVVLSR